MRQLLTYAVGGTAREIFVQQHHGPYGHPQGAFRDHTRGWRRRHNTWALGTPTRRLVAGPLHTSNVGLYLYFDDIASFDTRKRRQRLATLRAVFGRLAHVMHFHHHRQSGTITAAVSRCARLLAPLPRMGLIGRAKRLGTGGLLALLPIEALGEVAQLRFKRLHLRLQGGFTLHQTCMLGPPVVGFPLEGDIVLLPQHYRLFGERRGLLTAHRCIRGSGTELWLSIFHKLMLYQLFWKVPYFLMGHDGIADYLLDDLDN